MNRPRRFAPVVAVDALMIFAVLACGQMRSSSEPKTPVLPLAATGDLTQIDVCQAVPKDDIEAVIGRKLVSSPRRFTYYDTPDSGGCWYDAGKDSAGSAYFGYVVLTHIDAYDNQPLYRKTVVNGIGEAAYFNNGADARQLWVKANNKVAFVVAFGDEPNEAGAKAVAKLVAAAIK